MIFYKKKVAKAFHELSRHLKLSSYFQSQTFSVNYSTTITNNGPEIKSLTLIFPVPPTNDYQIISDLTMSSPGKIYQEREYNNRYFTAPLSLSPGKSSVIKQTFRASVKPIITNPRLLAVKKISSPKKTNRFIIMNQKINHIAASQTQQSRSDYEVMRALYSFILSRLTYGSPIKGLYSARESLTLKHVDCGGFVTLLASLFMAKNIASVPIFGFFAGYPKNPMHAWLHVKTEDDLPIPFDPSSDLLFRASQSFKSGGFGWIGSDRIAFSYGCDYEIVVDGKKTAIDILQNPLVLPQEAAVSLSTEFSAVPI